MGGFVFVGTGENFSELVIANSRRGLVVVDFWAPWAGPSQRQRAILTNLAEEFGGRFLLVTVNTDTEKSIANQFGVKSLPSMKLFRHGEVIEHIHGMQPEADYQAIVERNLTRPGSVQQQILRLWAEGQRDRALQALAEEIMAAPEDAELPLLMGKLLIQQGRLVDAHEVLVALPNELKNNAAIAELSAHLELMLAAEQAEPVAELEAKIAAGSENSEARFQLAALHLINDEYEQVLELLLELLRSDPDFKNGLAKQAILAVLGTINGDDEMVAKYRSELFRSLH